MLDCVPRLPLGRFPTPADRLDLNRAAPGFKGTAWVKRDDLSGDELGGGKVRKLEFLFADAMRRSAAGVLTAGGIGSNHALATAFYAPEASLRTHLVVYPHHVTPASRATLRAVLALGTAITWCPHPNATPLMLAASFARLRATGRRPYLIPFGGSSPLGTLGFVRAAAEIAAQVAAGELPKPHAVVVAYGSGGAAAGLALGFAMAGLDTQVLAVRVYPLPATTAAYLRIVAARAARLISRLTGSQAPKPVRLRVLGDFIGSGYAEPTEASSAAHAIAADFGLTLDPTYTSKAFAALLDLAAGPGHRRSNLLFVNTYDSRIPGALGEPLPDDLVPTRLRPYV